MIYFRPECVIGQDHVEDDLFLEYAVPMNKYRQNYSRPLYFCL